MTGTIIYGIFYSVLIRLTLCQLLIKIRLSQALGLRRIGRKVQSAFAFHNAASVRFPQLLPRRCVAAIHLGRHRGRRQKLSGSEAGYTVAPSECEGGVSDMDGRVCWFGVSITLRKDGRTRVWKVRANGG
jgi:hypothetical protein